MPSRRLWKNVFAQTYHQKFCSDTCRWRFHKQKLYTLREKKGLCVQCGGKMIEKWKKIHTARNANFTLEKSIFRKKEVKNKIIYHNPFESFRKWGVAFFTLYWQTPTFKRKFRQFYEIITHQKKKRPLLSDLFLILYSVFLMYFILFRKRI